MNKRILSLTLALVMILGTFTAVFAEVTTVEQKAAEFLRDNGVLEGDDKGDLLLDKKLERRDAVVLSARLLGEEEKAANTKFDEKTPSWTDVRTDKFYVPFFAWAETTGRFEGKGEGIFEPRAGLTTQEYATVLLRILGHELNGKDAWKSVMELAKKEGLLENVDAKADDILMRGNMAVMTLNALGATVKGTGKTLADELNIKLPVPAKLEVEDVYADNLKQVKVKLNKEANLEDVQDKTVYSIKGLEIERINVDGETVILEVKNKMTENKEYELVIKGLKDGDNKVDYKQKFKAIDNEAPFVKEVEGLGTKAFKVVMSEPVTGATARDFKLNGKTLNGKVDVVGNELFVRVYKDMEPGIQEVRIGQLKDYNDFKSVAADYEFEVVEDKDAPVVVEAIAKTKTVVVTFDEVIDPNSVNSRSIFWKSGSNKRYAESAKVLAGDRVEFTFSSNNELPLHELDLFIDGIKDFSGNTMKETKVTVKAELDTVRPEVKSVDLVNNKELKVIFTKNVSDKETGNGAKNTNNYYVLDEKDNKIKAFSVSGSNDTYTVTLRESLKEGKTYRFVVSGIEDTNKYANMMFTYEEELNVKDKSKPEYLGFSVAPKGDRKYREYTVYFSKEMDAATLSDADNYVISTSEDAKGSVKVLSEINNEIVIGRDRKTATITIYDEDLSDEVKRIGVLGVKDLKGNKLINYGVMETVDSDLSKAIEVKSTSAIDVKENKKVEVKFTKEVSYVDLDKVTVDGKKANDKEINGKTVVFTFEDLKADEIKGKSIVLDKKSIEATDGSELETTATLELTDAIEPKITDVIIKDENGEVTISVKFNRSVKEADIKDAFSIDGATLNELTVAEGGAKEATGKLDVEREDSNKNLQITLNVVNRKPVISLANENIILASEPSSIKSNEITLLSNANSVKEMDKKAVKDAKAKFDTQKPYSNLEAVENVTVENEVKIKTEVIKEATQTAEGEVKVILTKGEAKDTVNVKLAKLGA